jgi:hypothetical protein
MWLLGHGASPASAIFMLSMLPIILNNLPWILQRRLYTFRSRSLILAHSPSCGRFPPFSTYRHRFPGYRHVAAIHQISSGASDRSPPVSFCSGQNCSGRTITTVLMSCTPANTAAQFAPAAIFWGTDHVSQHTVLRRGVVDSDIRIFLSYKILRCVTI